MPGLEKSQYKISIHAPRVGSDLFVFPDPQLPIYFNPRSPCGERPQAYLMAAQLAELFQSTLPVWGATNAGDIIPFYCNISIHAPRVGSDATRLITSAGLLGFQSTLPVWGATGPEPDQGHFLQISIHAPRVGSDRLLHSRCRLHPDFNPRSPCGERPGRPPTCPGPLPFQSTLPVWGATSIRSRSQRMVRIFQSTLPVWGATHNVAAAAFLGGISIHAPRVGSDAVYLFLKIQHP